MHFTNSENWELYTMDGCGWCVKARQDIEKRIQTHGGTLKTIKGAESTDVTVIAKLKATGKPTWPKIFLNNRFLGGYSDLEKYIKDNK
jgi:glutaredoxin